MANWLSDEIRRGQICDTCREEACKRFCWEASRKVALRRPSHRRKDIIKINFKQAVMAWTVFIWLRTGTSGGLLWTRLRTLEFHIVRGIAWLACEPNVLSRWAPLHGVMFTSVTTLNPLQCLTKAGNSAQTTVTPHTYVTDREVRDAQKFLRPPQNNQPVIFAHA